jgi:hypothetical protein
MDASSLSILVGALAPVLGALICLGMPVAIVFTVKHFKLRHRELELEAEIHGRQTQARLATLEARLGTLEMALGALVRGPAAGALQDRLTLLEPPPSSSEEPTQSSDLQRLRTR